MTDRIRYESKKAFEKARASGEALPPGLKAFAAGMGRWAAERDLKLLLDKRKNAHKDTGQPNDIEP